MTMTQKSVLKNFTRGGQIILHELRMLAQVTNDVLLVSLVLWTLLNIGWFYFATPPLQRYLAEQWLIAEGLLFFDNKAKQLIEEPSGKKYFAYSQQVVNSPRMKVTIEEVEQATIKRFIYTAIFYPVMLLVITNWLRRRGKAQSADDHLRGGKLASSAVVTELLEKNNNASAITIGGVPIVKFSERSHFFVHGTTGTGKTQSFGHLIDHIRAQKQRAIIYDKGGIFIQSFYDPKVDIILNPLDTRSAPWCLWGECQDQADYDSLTEAFIPAAANSDPFWIEAARTVFASAAYKMSLQKKPTIPELFKTLLCSNLNELAELLQGTGAESLVSDKIEKTALCIRASVATAVKSLQYLTNKNANFAVRDWVLDEKKQRGFLFISSVADKHATLRPLISMWLDIAVKTILSLPEDEQRRVWIMLDELPTLNKLPCLQNTLALGRKYGVCGVIGIQNYAMLQLIYGNSGAESLKDLCNTSLYFRSPSRKMSDWAANELGESEVEEAQEGVSYGANTIRDGVSVHSHRSKRNLIISSEIMTLNNLEAFLKLAGNYPICKVKIDYVTRSNVNPTFIPTKFAPEQQEISDAINKVTRNAPIEVQAVLKNMQQHPFNMALEK